MEEAPGLVNVGAKGSVPLQVAGGTTVEEEEGEGENNVLLLQIYVSLPYPSCNKWRKSVSYKKTRETQ